MDEQQNSNSGGSSTQGKYLLECSDPLDNFLDSLDYLDEPTSNEGGNSSNNGSGGSGSGSNNGASPSMSECDPNTLICPNPGECCTKETFITNSGVSNYYICMSDEFREEYIALTTHLGYENHTVVCLRP